MLQHYKTLVQPSLEDWVYFYFLHYRKVWLPWNECRGFTTILPGLGDLGYDGRLDRLVLEETEGWPNNIKYITLWEHNVKYNVYISIYVYIIYYTFVYIKFITLWEHTEHTNNQYIFPTVVVLKTRRCNFKKKSKRGTEDKVFFYTENCWYLELAGSEMMDSVATTTLERYLIRHLYIQGIKRSGINAGKCI